ncbi:MAG: hypothetical protein ACE5E3_06815, partial [Mariprofundus sp.]
MKKIISSLISPISSRTKDMSVTGMLRAGFLALGAMILVAGGIVWNDTRTISDEMHDFHDVELEVNQEVASAALQLVQVQQFLTDAALTHAKEPLQEAQHAASAFRQSMDNLESKIAQVDQSEADVLTKAIATIRPQFEQMLSIGLNMVEVYKTEGHQAGNKVMELFDGQVSGLGDTMTGLADYALKHMRDALEADIHHIEIFQITFGVIMLILLGICITIYRVVAGGISGRINPVLVVLQEWSTGSMEPRITDIQGRGEIADMSRAVNNIGDQVETLLREIVSSLNQLQAGNLERRIDSRALSTGMVQVASVVNASLDAMAAFNRKAASDQQRTEEFEVVISDVTEKLQTLSIQTDDTADALAAMATQSSA